MAEQKSEVASGFATSFVAPPILPAQPESIAEVANLRHRELKTICDRLGRMSTRRWDRWFAGAAVLLLGGLVGAGFGLIPFLATSPGPTPRARLIYFGAMAMTALLAVVFGLACGAVKGEREDSVAAIKADLDQLMSAYETDAR